jgi:uncharacterized protein YndB with AHSA1/START domain
MSAKAARGMAHGQRHAAAGRAQLHLQGRADAVVGRDRAESSPLDTVVTWTLTPTPSGGTRLALEHSGFVPGNAFAFDGARKGWERMLGEGLPEALAGEAGSGE